MKIKDLGEFKLIDRIARGIKLSSRIVKGVGDDAAVLSSHAGDKYLLFTCDMLVEARHFHKKTDPYLVGKKSLSVNVSDIAAMGGVPKTAIISLAVPPSLNIKYVDDLYRGIKYVANKFKIDLAGGDTVGSDKVIISIALLGETEKNSLVLRSGAKEGDAVFLTGNVGGSIKGKHLSFTPRVEESRFLVKNFNIHSMIDVSDGLIADLGHILRSSKVGALVREKDIPISKLSKDFNSAINEGEDFELVFTLPADDKKRLIKTWPFKTRLSDIGQIRKSKGLHLARKNNRIEKTAPKGYTHF